MRNNGGGDGSTGGSQKAGSGQRRATGGATRVLGAVNNSGRKPQEPTVYDQAKYRNKISYIMREKEIKLRDGTVITAGVPMDDPKYCLPGTNSVNPYYLLVKGMDSIERIRYVGKHDEIAVYHEDGAVTASKVSKRLVAQDNGKRDITPEMVAAVMAGDYVMALRAVKKVQDAGGDLSTVEVEKTYMDSFNVYNQSRLSTDNTKAAQAYFALLKSQSDYKVTFGDPTEYARAVAEAAHPTPPGTQDTDDEGEVAGADEQRRNAAAHAAGAAQAASNAANPRRKKRRLTAAHQAMKEHARIEPFDSSNLTDEDLALVPELDPTYVFTTAHREVIEDISDTRRANKKSYSIMGVPGTGKNYVLEQLSAIEGRPYREIDAHEEMEVRELFGSTTSENGNLRFVAGEVTAALQKGYRVVINEPNALPGEIQTIFHNIVGSTSGTGRRFITIPNAESDRFEIPVHPDADIVFTFNPFGTVRDARLKDALASRLTPIPMRQPTDNEGGRVVASQANRMLANAGEEGRLNADDGKRYWKFFKILQSAWAQDNTGGFEKQPEARWIHYVAYVGHSEYGSKSKILRLCEDLITQDPQNEAVAGPARKSIEVQYDRCFGMRG